VEEYGEGGMLEQVQRKYEFVYDTYWEKRYSLNPHQVFSRDQHVASQMFTILFLSLFVTFYWFKKNVFAGAHVFG